MFNVVNEDGISVELVVVIVIINKELVVMLKVDVEVSYVKNEVVIEFDFFKDVYLEGMEVLSIVKVISNFDFVVDRSKIGDYIVMINVINEDGVVFILIEVIVYIGVESVLVIIVNVEVKYNKYE